MQDAVDVIKDFDFAWSRLAFGGSEADTRPRLIGGVDPAGGAYCRIYLFIKIQASRGFELKLPGRLRIAVKRENVIPVISAERLVANDAVKHVPPPPSKA